MRMLAFGEILWDVYPDAKAIGGASLNLAAHAALLGGDVYISSALGDDSLGKEAIEVTRSFGIKDDFISTVKNKETGAVVVTLNEKGVPSYEIKDNVAYDFIKPAECENKSFDVLVFGTLALRHENNKNVLSKIIDTFSFSEIYADLNVRLPHSDKSSAEFCFSNATIIKVSDEELPIVSEWIFGKVYSPSEFAKKASLKYKDVKLVIITFGEKGSIAYSSVSGQFYHSDAVPTSVVSTVGAGDSFGAAFLTKYFSECEICECLAFASRLSSFVCSRKEAVPDISEFVQ